MPTARPDAVACANDRTAGRLLRDDLDSASLLGVLHGALVVRRSCGAPEPESR